MRHLAGIQTDDAYSLGGYVRRQAPGTEKKTALKVHNILHHVENGFILIVCFAKSSFLISHCMFMNAPSC